MARKSNSGVFTKTPTISTGAYTAGDVVGGLQKFSQAAGAFCNAVLQSITVKEKGSQKAALTLLFFREAPTGVAVDNAAFAFSAADLAKCIGKVNIAAADYETVGGYSIATVYSGLVVSGHADSGPTTDLGTAGDLWMVIVTTGTPTYATTGDLTVEAGTLQD